LPCGELQASESWLLGLLQHTQLQQPAQEAANSTAMIHLEMVARSVGKAVDALL
jgi:hypothetical protein